jgi:hypothetical protein
VTAAATPEPLFVLAGRALRVPVASATGGYSRSTAVDPLAL